VNSSSREFIRCKFISHEVICRILRHEFLLSESIRRLLLLISKIPFI
jgi:hypothetical protein